PRRLLPRLPRRVRTCSLLLTPGTRRWLRWMFSWNSTRLPLTARRHLVLRQSPPTTMTRLSFALAACASPLPMKGPSARAATPCISRRAPSSTKAPARISSARTART
ncbi:unnamed protein product, partial [Ectocarpus fasciculatus]